MFTDMLVELFEIDPLMILKQQSDFLNKNGGGNIKSSVTKVVRKNGVNQVNVYRFNLNIKSLKNCSFEIVHGNSTYPLQFLIIKNKLRSVYAECNSGMDFIDALFKFFTNLEFLKNTDDDIL